MVITFSVNNDPQQVSRNGGGSEYPLRAMRKHMHLTQQEVAKRLGVSQRRVSVIERSDVGSLKLVTLQRYIAALGGDIRVVVAVDWHEPY